MAQRRGAGRNGRAPPQAVPQEQMMERLHTVLYESVGDAVKHVQATDDKWSESEMVKRIVRYIYKASTADGVATLPWEEACKKFLSHALGAYTGSCQERPWFYDLDLADAFARATWEVLTANASQPRPQYPQVEDIAKTEYESWLDQTLHNKAMWISVEEVFQNDSKVQGKIFASLQKTYPPALDEVIEDRRQLEDLEKLQMFVKKWITDCLTRSWNAIGDSERILSEDIAVRLFQKLLAPFGPENGFSCLPSILTENIGRPPDHWPFIRQTVRGIFRNWNAVATSGGAAKKRRKTAAAEDDDNENGSPPARAPPRRAPAVPDDDPPEEGLDPEEPPADADLEGEDALEGDPPGHPMCTSQEDCQGSAEDILIRHILNGKNGDLYCRTCWESFLQQNPHLEGREE